MLVTTAELRTYMDVAFTNRQLDAAELVLAGLQSEMETYLGRKIEVEELTEEHVVPSSQYALPTSSFFYDNESSTFNDSNIMDYVIPGVHLPLRQSPVHSVSAVNISSSTNSINLAEFAFRTATISGAVEINDLVRYTTSPAHTFTLAQTVSVENITPSVYNRSTMTILDVTSTTFSVKKWNTGSAFPAYGSGGKATATGSGYIVHRWGLELFGAMPNDRVKITYKAGLKGTEIPTLKLMILRAATREMQNMHDDVVGVKDLNPRNVAVAETGFLEKEISVLKSLRRRRIS